MEHALERILRGRPEGWRRRALALGGRQYETDGLVTTLTGIPAPWLNPTSVVADPRDPAAALAAAEASYPVEVGGFGIDVVIDRFPAVREAAGYAGLRRLASQPLMVAGPAAVARPASPPGVQLIRAEDRLRELAEVDAAVFDDPPETAIAFSTPAVFADPAFRAYAALHEGRIVAVAQTSCVDGLLSVNGVGTLPGHRRQGIGAALTGFAVQDRALEVDLVFLEASEIAAGVYRALGFRELATWEVWIRP